GTRGNRRERRSPHRPAASARIHGRLDRVSAPQGRGRRSDGARGGTPSLSETQETRTSNNSRRKSDGASNAALPEYAGVPPDVEAHGLPPRISPPPRPAVVAVSTTGSSLMQSDIDAQLNNFFEDTPTREFDVVLRGYDRHQVHD